LHLSASAEHTHSLKVAIKANIATTLIGVLYEVLNSSHNRHNSSLANVASATTLSVSAANMVGFSNSEIGDNVHFEVARLHAISDMMASSITTLTNLMTYRYPLVDFYGTITAGLVRTGFSIKQHKMMSEKNHLGHSH
jgi:hypothetical protein